MDNSDIKKAEKIRVSVNKMLRLAINAELYRSKHTQKHWKNGRKGTVFLTLATFLLLLVVFSRLLSTVDLS